MKVGDLVMIRQDIKEFTDVMGQRVGLIVDEIKPSVIPPLFSVLWPDSSFEDLYADELEIFSEKEAS